MQGCCSILCPHPTKNRMIEPVGAAGKMRSALLIVILGEIASIAIKVKLFGLTSLLALIAVWIVYVGYATMHFCQSLFICLIGVLDLVILVLNKSNLELTHSDNILYYCIIGFAVFKILMGITAFFVFKKAFLQEHGHLDVWGSSGKQNDDYVAAPSEPEKPGFKSFQGKGHSLA